MASQLTARQKEILLFGSSRLAGRGFITKADESAAWVEHRSVLLKECGSVRPHAYVKYELCPETPAWIRVAQEIFRRGFVNPQVQAAAEQASVTLSSHQAAGLHAEFETAESIRALGLPGQSLEEMCREFGHAQAYHAHCGRPALVEKYARIGAAIREVLRERLIILIPPNSENIQ